MSDTTPPSAAVQATATPESKTPRTWAMLDKGCTGIEMSKHAMKLERENADLVAALEEKQVEARVDELNAFANELEKKKDAFVHENFMQDPETGTWEGGSRKGEYVDDQEELIEEIRNRAAALIAAHKKGAGL